MWCLPPGVVVVRRLEHIFAFFQFFQWTVLEVFDHPVVMLFPFEPLQILFIISHWLQQSYLWPTFILYLTISYIILDHIIYIMPILFTATSWAPTSVTNINHSLNE